MPLGLLRLGGGEGTMNIGRSRQPPRGQGMRRYSGGVAFAHSVLAQEPPPPTNLPANRSHPDPGPDPDHGLAGGLSRLVFQVAVRGLADAPDHHVRADRSRPLYLCDPQHSPSPAGRHIARRDRGLRHHRLAPPITAGYTNEQVAPAFGLFGTIIGYMLGRMNQPPGQPTETPRIMRRQGGRKMSKGMRILRL